MDNLISFIQEVDKLKSVNRKTLNYHEKRYENSAEHSWHLALAVLVFASEANKSVDVLKCLKMAILHDIVEIDAGDQIIYCDDPGKFERELSAAQRIFGLLPKEIENEFLDLWIEFEKKETAEAKYVGSLDRFLPLMSNVLNQGHSWKKHQISYEQVIQKNAPAISAGSNTIWEEVEKMLQSCSQSGDFAG